MILRCLDFQLQLFSILTISLFLFFSLVDILIYSLCQFSHSHYLCSGFISVDQYLFMFSLWFCFCLSPNVLIFPKLLHPQLHPFTCNQHFWSFCLFHSLLSIFSFLFSLVFHWFLPLLPVYFPLLVLFLICYLAASVFVRPQFFTS